MSRGRKKGSRKVECPECIESMMVLPGEVKICPHCDAKIGKAAVNRLIKKAKKGEK